MDASVSWGKLGAKPKPQATFTPDEGELVTRDGEGNHETKPLHSPLEAKVPNNFSTVVGRNYSHLGGPGTSMSSQGSGGMSPPVLQPLPQHAPAEQGTPVDGPLQSTPIFASSRTLNFTSCDAKTSLFCAGSPEISSTPNQTTSTCSTWTSEDPGPGMQLHTPEPPLGTIVEINKSKIATTKQFKVANVLEWLHWIPALFEMATDKKKPNKNSAFLEDGGEQLQRCGHTVKMEEQILKIRSALDQSEEELKSLRIQSQQEADNMKRHYEGQIGRLSSELHQKQQELQDYRVRMEEYSNFYKQEMNKMCATLAEKGNEAEFYKNSMSEREKYHQRKLEEKRSILQQKDEELKSFKDRVAGEVALSIKTGKTESMNNPVSKSRLKEMYEDLRLLWPTIKNLLKSNNNNPDSVKALLQGVFAAASEDMEQRRTQIDQMFGLNEPESRPKSQKIHEYRTATIQYLQLTLYHNGKEEAESKMASLQREDNPEVVMESLRSQCQWLGNLMALNNPPLQPDWENHDPGMNMWDILPRNISASTAL